MVCERCVDGRTVGVSRCGRGLLLLLGLGTVDFDSGGAVRWRIVSGGIFFVKVGSV